MGNDSYHPRRCQFFLRLASGRMRGKRSSVLELSSCEKSTPAAFLALFPPSLPQSCLERRSRFSLPSPSLPSPAMSDLDRQIEQLRRCETIKVSGSRRERE